MARVDMAPEVADDLDRILSYQVAHGAADAAARIMEIIQGIDVLAVSPMIGRSLARGKRELAIGRKHHGYVVLYEYLVPVDIVRVLAIRSQREAKYARPE